MDMDKDTFWRTKSLEELKNEQKVEPVERLEKLVGKGSDLWDSDAEFEQFVNGIHERRYEPAHT